MVIALGLLWRSEVISLSPFSSKYGGDALWALMVFFGMGFLFPRIPTLFSFLLALGFSWAVEFSQIYHAPWIDAIRVTLPGRLILGSTFAWPDLVAYLGGTALGACGEFIWRKV
jgi:hypothetical protein